MHIFTYLSKFGQLEISYKIDNIPLSHKSKRKCREKIQMGKVNKNRKIGKYGFGSFYFHCKNIFNICSSHSCLKCILKWCMYYTLYAIKCLFNISVTGKFTFILTQKCKSTIETNLAKHLKNIYLKICKLTELN